MFSLSDSQAENSTYWALKAGFRLIDTARIYGNEETVGRGLKRAIKEGIVTREEVFITTKMWTSDLICLGKIVISRNMFFVFKLIEIIIFHIIVIEYVG